MTKKTINKLGLLLILSSGALMGFSSHDSIQKLVGPKVALLSGIDFDTAKLVALNPETSELVPACVSPATSEVASRAVSDKSEKHEYKDKDKGRDSKTKCDVELLLDNQDHALKAALELSKNPIKGEIKVDGELKQARHVVTVTTLYQGSTCNTVYSGGTQYVNCVPRRR